ncbi:hypothetical protein BDV23DRAFT_133219 [Aspergillus alliaceus]|uniref:Uncharacterized protein n=1 Tax=Petromyces alliaceus TaxID=209559 RepID=A0A5N7BYJ3_PETAA|nr:hypothetical protein BDV23DRAFT_133219 [Aspergillus alliaceus]
MIFIKPLCQLCPLSVLLAEGKPFHVHKCPLALLVQSAHPIFNLLNLSREMIVDQPLCRRFLDYQVDAVGRNFRGKLARQSFTEFLRIIIAVKPAERLELLSDFAERPP